MVMHISMALDQILSPQADFDIAAFDDLTTPVTIYVDGCCVKNPGPGGYSAMILTNDGTYMSLIGSEPHTSSNRMTLQAVIAVLEEFVKLPRMELRIYSDSEYLVRTMNEHIDEWKSRGWKRKSGGAPENIDLWKRLNGLALRHNVDWVWLSKGERDAFQKLATKLAGEAAKAELLKA